MFDMAYGNRFQRPAFSPRFRGRQTSFYKSRPYVRRRPFAFANSGKNARFRNSRYSGTVSARRRAVFVSSVPRTRKREVIPVVDEVGDGLFGPLGFD